jgi:putative transposase
VGRKTRVEALAAGTIASTLSWSGEGSARDAANHTRVAARADVFDYIARFYNTVRGHSTVGYLSPVAFEKKIGLA